MKRRKDKRFKITAALMTLLMAVTCIFVGRADVFAASLQEDEAKLSCNYTLTGNPSDYVCQATPMQMHGKLAVKGTNIVDSRGKVVQLRGVSLHGIQHTNGSTTAFKSYANLKAFQILRDEWGVNLIRIPVYTVEGGYCQGNAASMDATIKNAVTYATKLGMYVIIDWHILSDGNPQTYQSQATAFFKNYANKYKDYKNVIFEICNEPNGVNWPTVKSYAVSIIKTIRTYDADALIIVGTPQWSQLPTWSDSSAADNPIMASEVGGSGTGLAKNVLYSIHFYAATHYSDIQSNVTYAYSKGLPVFCSEFGISDASGSGNIDIQNANTWINLLKKYKISFVCWNLSNNNESSAMFKPTCARINGWKNSDLTTSGAWFINTVRPMYDAEMESINPNMYEGVDYSAVYDFDYYCNRYSDIKERYGSDKKGALKQFVLYGMKRGRQAKASFSVKSYAYKYYDLRKQYKNDLPQYYLHYIKYGKKEGRVATGTYTMQGGLTYYKGVKYSDVYKVGYYANKYPELRTKFGYDDSLYIAHFVNYGMKSGKQGSAEFNPYKYRNRYTYLKNKFGNDMQKYYIHYMKLGKPNGLIGN